MRQMGQARRTSRSICARRESGWQDDVGPTIAWAGQRSWRLVPWQLRMPAALQQKVRMPIWSGFRRFYYELLYESFYVPPH